MNTMLTPNLLDYLMKQGYRYCLSKKNDTGRSDVNVCIALTPVIQRPDSRLVINDYDTWFSITDEPAQMAVYTDDCTLVIVKMNEEDIKSYPYSLTKF